VLPVCCLNCRGCCKREYCKQQQAATFRHLQWIHHCTRGERWQQQQEHNSCPPVTPVKRRRYPCYIVVVYSSVVLTIGCIDISAGPVDATSPGRFAAPSLTGAASAKCYVSS
jgi:hypothetical protein